MSNRFVHLSVHSTYSIQDGLASPTETLEWAKDNNSPAIALTDNANLHAAVKFCQAARDAQVKPILGMDLGVCDSYSKQFTYQVTLLAKNKAGYKNLVYLSTQALTAGVNAKRRGQVERDFFKEHTQGLLVLGGGGEGDVGYCLLHGDEREAKARLEWWLDSCGDNYYLELNRLGLSYEEELNFNLLKIAKEFNCPPIATNKARFINEQDFHIHRARVDINRGEILGRESKPHPYSPSQYLKDPAEMEKLFADIPAAIANTHYAAQRCSFLIEEETNLPHYPHAGNENKKDMLQRLSYEGLQKRFGDDWKNAAGGQYLKRLEMELKVIDEMHYNDYFLIVGDFINWSKDNHIPVGPARGSGGGSLVAYATRITNVDPIEHNLLFERFLNQGRGSMPDFDVDICMDRRGEVINYLVDTYGKDNAVQIVSFGTMKVRGAVRDTTRVLGKPYSLGDRISTLIPQIARNLDEAAEMEGSLRSFVEYDGEAKEIFEFAKNLEGQVKNTGLHAAGLVIAPGPVKDYCPLFQDENGKMVSQYDKDDLEIIGLVKFDILGLRNLTTIEETMRLIKETDGEDINMESLPYDDAETMKTVCEGNTYAVFQLESRGMRDVARRMQPKVFEDIVSLIALYRPGPMELIDDFIENKKKLEEGKTITYPDPVLEEILRPTYGIAVYQEQVMQMAQKLAGFTLSDADVLRAAMGKKNKKVMAKQRSYFIEGAIKEQGYDEKKAGEMFDIIQSFAGYGFNRSHSVGYGILAYWTAYLKTHYPSHYMTATLTSETSSSDKISYLIEECRRLNISLRGPDINLSQNKFTISKEKDSYMVDYSLAAIKNVGGGVAKAIVEERNKKPYESFLDFCGRINPEYLNQGVLESLVFSGAFASLEGDYYSLHSGIGQGLQLSKKNFQERTDGLSDMFGENLSKTIVRKKQNPVKWSDKFIARKERGALGFYLRYDPFSLYQQELRQYVPTALTDLHPNKESLVCGRILGARRTFNNNRKMYSWNLTDESGEVQVRCFEEAIGNREACLKNDNIIALSGKLVTIETKNGKSSVRKVFQASRIYDLGDLRAKNHDQIVIFTDMNSIKEDILTKLREASASYRDDKGLRISLHVQNREKQREFRVVNIMEGSKFLPSNLFMEALETIMPDSEINLQ